MFTLKLKTTNAAFSDGNGREEVARILCRVADRVVRGEEYGSIQDINGNTVGEFDLELPEVNDDEEQE
jgi:hypothetical protein